MINNQYNDAKNTKEAKEDDGDGDPSAAKKARLS